MTEIIQNYETKHLMEEDKKLEQNLGKGDEKLYISDTSHSAANYGNLILEVGKTYKSKDGRLVKIIKGNPPIDGKRDGWNGIYWGDSVDKKKPKIDHERYTFEGKWWSYISGFSIVGYQELSDPEMDLVEVT